ncbi:hypothetical protein VTG60DRAFT_831 [Thermothelomyces hinnuleus]
MTQVTTYPGFFPWINSSISAPLFRSCIPLPVGPLTLASQRLRIHLGVFEKSPLILAALIPRRPLGVPTMRASVCLAVMSAVLCPVRAAYQGFNYGAFFTDNTPKMQSDFEAEFKTAQNLLGAPAGGFNSARLYTMIVSQLSLTSSLCRRTNQTSSLLPLFSSDSNGARQPT